MQIFTSKVDKAREFIEQVGAKKIPHTQNKSLYHHLIRTHEILAAWGCDEHVQLAGMHHSLYSTAFFKQTLRSIEKRELKSVLDTDIEKLVYLFAILDRETVTPSPDKKQFTFKHYGTKESISCSLEEGVALIHIALANDIDHIGLWGASSCGGRYEKYRPLRSFLNSKAQFELDKLIYPKKAEVHPLADKTYIRFIGHAGAQISNGETSVVIDPWLYDSRRERPLIEGLDPTQKTIDYLLPEPRNTTSEIAPDIVCLSHFHTHHAPLREILEFAQIKPITIVCPVLTPEKLTLLKRKIGDYMYGRIAFIFVSEDKEINIRGVHIRALVHRSESMQHLMFHVSLTGKSILHIADASVNNEGSGGNQFSNTWERVHKLYPDFLFIGAAGHLEKKIKDGTRSIIETTTFTPVQAAKLAASIMPRLAGVVGIYNHSVWDDRLEMGCSVTDAENQFYWSLSYLAPSIKVKKLLPGDVFY